MKKQALQLIDNQSVGEVNEPKIDSQRKFIFGKIPFPTPKKTKFKFIDLFAVPT